MERLLLSGSTAGLFLQVVPIACLTGILYAAFRFARLKKRNVPVDWTVESIRFLFVCYLSGLVNLVLVPANLWTAIWFYIFNGYSGVDNLGLFSGGFNFVPAIIKYLSGELTIGNWVREMLTGNLLMFVPLGFFLPLVFRKLTIRTALILALAVPFAIEILQPIVGRSFDVDDLICNFAGILIGYGTARLVVKVN